MYHFFLAAAIVLNIVCKDEVGMFGLEFARVKESEPVQDHHRLQQITFCITMTCFEKR